MIIALCGPSGSGKTTLIDELVMQVPEIKKILSTTSKDTRLDDYHKVSREEFIQMIENDAFIEYTEYGGNFYGLTKESANVDIGIKAFDINGIKNLKAKGIDVLSIFVYRETEKLIETINERPVPDEEKRKRISQLPDEQKNRYDASIDVVLEVIEGDIQGTIERLKEIIL